MDQLQGCAIISLPVQVIYNHVQREVVERLAKKSVKLIEDQQLVKSLKSQDRVGPLPSAGQSVSNITLSWKEVSSL